MLIRNLPSHREQTTHMPQTQKNGIFQTVCVACFKKLMCCKSVSLKMYQPGIVKKIPILKMSPRLQYSLKSIFSSTCKTSLLRIEKLKFYFKVKYSISTVCLH